MLTKEQNELLTRTGPGTPGGALLRRYWQPVALAEELPPDGPPLPVRVLGEDLVLFRDEYGRLGLLGLHCSHRGADLSYGRIEHGGLRCLYHGWLFDVQGRCLEQPGEPAGSTFKERIRHPAYPCREIGGLILAYLGPGEPPEVPAYEFLQVPAEQRWATKLWQACNYLQGNEGNIDPQHLSFLHRQFDETSWQQGRLSRTVAGSDASSMALYQRDVAPTIEVEETDYGLRIYSVRRISASEHYVRISNFILPNLSAFPGRTEADGYQVHWHVPVDDTHHWKYILAFRRSGPIEREILQQEMAAEVTADYRPIRTAANRYLQDREEMRSRTFSGMGPNFQLHDTFATESQGPIQDRTKEHLGATDLAIAMARQQLLRAIRDVQEGRDPPHVIRHAAANRFDHLVVRAEVVPQTVDWRTYWRAPAIQEQLADTPR
ncbi:MAG TPA: Rieske 2Fe-2S domain-containing protein [Chloroflexota bacterium]|nr:Rieske 2Fe-2S domain-containing protein [Chloroflexota bacterium]